MARADRSIDLDLQLSNAAEYSRLHKSGEIEVMLSYNGRQRPADFFQRVTATEQEVKRLIRLATVEFDEDCVGLAARPCSLLGPWRGTHRIALIAQNFDPDGLGPMR